METAWPETRTRRPELSPVHRDAPDFAPAVHGALPSTSGSVKWFNDQKGFGFILDSEGRDVFVHYAVIEGGGFKTLEENEAVLYDVEDGPKGRRATRVVRQSEGLPNHRRGGR
jgi:CspA family cold shock protein